MASIQVNPKTSKRGRVKFAFHRFLMIIVAIMAVMTFTACPGNGDPNENGENGGVSGKRIKTMINTTAAGATLRYEYTYNSNGSKNRADAYDESSNRVDYIIYTNNPDGTIAKQETFSTSGNQVVFFSYDANKKPIKAEGATFNSLGEHPITYDYTFQNGRKIRQVSKIGSTEVIYDFNYDSAGRRTTITEKNSIVGTRQYTRTYNSDGTLQKVTTDGFPGLPATGFTNSFIWENGKTTVNDDDFSVH